MNDITIYFSPETLIYLLIIIPIGIVFWITIQQYLEERNIHSFYMTMIWFCMTVWSIFHAHYFLFRMDILIFFSNFFMIIMGFFIVLLLDTVSRDTVDPIKMVILFVTGTIVLLTGFRVVFYFDIFIQYGFWLFYMIKIYKNSPPKQKYHALLAVIGLILIGVVAPILDAFLIFEIIPAIDAYFIGIGSILMAISFKLAPKLVLIPPFEVMRISIIDTDKGISLYTHDWNANSSVINESLFSGMLQGISIILNEAINKGNLREIRLEEAVLLVRRSAKFPIACVMVSSKSSYTLKAALKNYTEKFTEFLLFNTTPKSLEKQASRLVKEVFGFIPNYDSTLDEEQD
ncbi:MAG: hypothetical protein GY870_08355 [archaeon]|nr:hypothetical protein [archaeon]